MVVNEGDDALRRRFPLDCSIQCFEITILSLHCKFRTNT